MFVPLGGGGLERVFVPVGAERADLLPVGAEAGPEGAEELLDLRQAW